jgi:hypothetical protein
MATTTNYSWTTPDDTALVKDGASAIRTLGSAVDTTTKALNPSTTLGDIEYRSATSNTNTRLAIGSTNQVLTVSGGVPTWAAPSASLSIAQITTGTVTSGATSLTLSGLTQDYLQFYLTGVTFNSGTPAIQFLVNGSTSAVYDRVGASINNTPTITSKVALAGSNFTTVGSTFNNSTNGYVITLTNCKAAGFTNVNVTAFTNTGTNFLSYDGIFKTAAQVTSLVINTDTAAQFSSSGTYTLYGA